MRPDRRRAPLRIALVLLSGGLAGCAYAPLRASTPPPARLPADLAAYYAYPPGRARPVVRLLEAQPRLRTYLVQFPLVAPDFEPTEPVVELEWYETAAPGRRPAIVFNPILGGDYPIERGVCRYFAARGFHVALIHRKTLKISPEQDPAHLELLLRQGVLRIRQTVDWVAAQERVDPSRLGSFGISMGGIAGVMAAAVEPRLRAHVIALAGGSIPEILTTSHDPLLTKPLAKYLAGRGMDRAALARVLREQVRTDPVRLAPYVDPRQVCLFVAVLDRTIGRANALRLWRALGRPRTVFMPFGHYSAYLSLPYLKYAALQFFREKLR